jgi:hypothetical protein
MYQWSSTNSPGQDSEDWPENLDQENWPDSLLNVNADVGEFF